MKNLSKLKNGRFLQNKFHGRYNYDELAGLASNKALINKIMNREKQIAGKWKTMIDGNIQKWDSIIKSRQEMHTNEPPEIIDNYCYFISSHPDPPYLPIYHRIPNDGISQVEEIVFDTIEVFKGKLGRWKNSSLLDKLKLNDDHSLIAYIIDLGNHENYIGGIKNISTRQQTGIIENCSNIEFSEDSKNIYILHNDTNNRPYKLTISPLLFTQSTDSNKKIAASEMVIYEDKNPTNYLSITKSKDKKYLIVSNESKNSTEIMSLTRCNEGEMELNIISERVEGKKTYLDHAGELWIGFEVDLGKNGVGIKVRKDSEENWRVIYQLPPECTIEEMDVFASHVVFYSQERGIPKLIILDLPELTLRYHNTPMNKDEGIMGVTSPGTNQSYNTSSLRYSFSSFFIHNHLYEVDLGTLQERLLLGNTLSGRRIGEEKYKCERVEVPSEGTYVPMTIISNPKHPKRRKTLIEGYGGYGLNKDITFNIAHLSALEEGWTIAYPHIRGGTERGVEWHIEGMLEGKTKGIMDYIGCINYLIGEGYSHPNLIAASGSSAGAIVLGAVVNWRPDLFRAVVLYSPFVDCLTTLLDEGMPLVHTDHLEYGNPIKDEKIYDIIRGYSPYDNIKRQEYPFMLIQYSPKDPRIPLSSTLRYIEKLRGHALPCTRFPELVDQNICCMSLSGDSGHFGSVDDNVNLQQKIFEMAWLDFVMF